MAKQPIYSHLDLKNNDIENVGTMTASNYKGVDWSMITGKPTIPDTSVFLPLAGGTMTGDLELATTGGGDSPTLIFSRGGIGSGNTDWAIKVSAGDLYFKKNAGSGWQNVVVFDETTAANFVNGLQSKGTDVSVVGHAHAIADVTGLSNALAGKSDTGHTHAIANVTGLVSALDGKSDTGHTHTKSDITDFPTNVSAFTNDAGYLTSHQTLDDKTFVLQGGTLLYPNASSKIDLNTITTYGNYYCNSNAAAAYFSNKPQNNAGAFILKVYNSLGYDSNNNYIRQDFKEYNTNRYWTRWTSNKGSTWSSWERYAVTGDIPSFAGTGSATTASRSDHNHDSAYLKLAGGTLAGPLKATSNDDTPIQIEYDDDDAYALKITDISLSNKPSVGLYLTGQENKSDVKDIMIPWKNGTLAMDGDPQPANGGVSTRTQYIETRKEGSDSFYGDQYKAYMQWEGSILKIKCPNYDVWVNKAGDADTIDGKHASDFATSNHTHDYLPLAGGTVSGQLVVDGQSKSLPLIVRGGISGYAENIRLLPREGDWTALVFAGTDAKEDNGTSPKTWSIHTKAGDFGICNNGNGITDLGTHNLSNIQGKWQIDGKQIATMGDIPSLSGYATESYVDTAVSNLINSAPGTLDTLNELAAALGNDPNFATTVATNIGGKVSKSGDTMTGALTFTSQSSVDNEKNIKFSAGGKIGGNDQGNIALIGTTKVLLKIGNNFISNFDSTGLVPYATNSYNLGSSSLKWNEAHIKTIYENGTSLANKYLALSGGTMGGAIKFKSGQAAYDKVSIVYEHGSVIGEDSSGGLGLYGAGNVYFRPNTSGGDYSKGMMLSSSSLAPTTNAGLSLGSSSTQWSKLYVDDIHSNNVAMGNPYHETGTVSKIATIADNGYIRYRTPTEIRGDIGALSSSDLPAFRSAGNAASGTAVTRSAAGTIKAEHFSVTSGDTTKATMQYNATDDCVEFVFA